MSAESIWFRLRARIAAMGRRDARRIAALPRFGAARLRRSLRRATLIGLAATLIGFGFNLWSAQDRACSISLAQPVASDLCGSLGIGHKPKRAERLAWENLPPGDCGALERFARQYGNGAKGSLATQLLMLRRTVRDPRVGEFAFDALAPGYARQGSTPFATRREAEAGARQEAIEDARKRYCAPSESSDRLLRVELISFTPVCAPNVPGYGIRCGADYQARCVMVGHKPREWCGPGGPG
jgi:hypothetical protein